METNEKELKSLISESVKSAITDVTEKDIKALGGRLAEIEKQSEYVKGLRDSIDDIKKSLPAADAALKASLELDAESRAQQNKMTRKEKQIFLASIFAPVDSKSREFLKAEGIDSEKVMKADINNIAVAAEGGNAVPVMAMQAILSIAINRSVGMQEATIIPAPLGAGSFTHVTDLEGNTVSYPGEATAVSASKTAFGKLTLTPKRRLAKAIISRELIDMSNINVVAHIIEKLGIALAHDTDQQLFAGTGSPITGLRGSSTLVSKVLAAAGGGFTATAAEILGTVGLLDDVEMNNLKWYLTHSMYWTNIGAIQDTTSGNRIIGLSDIQSLTSKKLLGYDVVEMPSWAMYKSSQVGVSRCMAIFADLKAAAVIAQFGLSSIEISKEATVKDAAGTARNLWDEGLVAIKAEDYFCAGLPDFSSLTKYPGVKIITAAA